MSTCKQYYYYNSLNCTWSLEVIDGAWTSFEVSSLTSLVAALALAVPVAWGGGWGWWLWSLACASSLSTLAMPALTASSPTEKKETKNFNYKPKIFEG